MMEEGVVFSLGLTNEPKQERNPSDEVCRGRLSQAPGFAQFFSELGEENKVVMEACWNWGWLYDLLGQIDGVGEVVLAHP